MPCPVSVGPRLAWRLQGTFRMRIFRGLVAAFTVCVGLVAVPFGVVSVLYVWVLDELDLPQPPAGQSLTRTQQIELWTANGGEAEVFEVERQYPWTPFLDVVIQKSSLPRAEAPLVWSVARQSLKARGRMPMGWWHLRGVALSIWVTRHWSAADLVNELARTQFLGRSAKGVEAGASAYFGRSFSALELHQRALLQGLAVNPSGREPHCYPERARKARSAVLNRWRSQRLLTTAEAEAAATQALDVVPLSRPCEERRADEVSRSPPSGE